MSRVSDNETDIQGGLADAISRREMDKFWMRKSGAVEKVVRSPWQGSAVNRLAAWPPSDWKREHPIEATHLGRCGYQSNSLSEDGGWHRHESDQCAEVRNLKGHRHKR